MTKKSRQKFKDLENEKSFYSEIKGIFHLFERAFRCQKLSQTLECIFKIYLQSFSNAMATKEKKRGKDGNTKIWISRKWKIVTQALSLWEMRFLSYFCSLRNQCENIIRNKSLYILDLNFLGSSFYTLHKLLWFNEKKEKHYHENWKLYILFFFRFTSSYISDRDTVNKKPHI